VLCEQEKYLIGMVYNLYKQYSASGLRYITHTEGPWKDTCLNTIIQHEAMRVYFESLLEANNPWTDEERNEVKNILEKAEADGEIDLSRFCVPVGN